MKIYTQLSLLGETELCIHHEAINAAIRAIAPDHTQAVKELKRLLVLHIKDIVCKYLSVVRHSRGAYLTIELQSKFDEADVLKKKIRRNSSFDKVQGTLNTLIPLLEALLSRPESRFYRSQASKLDFLNQVTQLQIEDLKTTKNVHV